MIYYEIPPDVARIEFDGSHRKLVADKDIMLGEVIVTLPLISQSEPDRYSVEASPGIHIDCSNSLAGACNHSCNPNASVRHYRLVAWSCIKEGDEITIDYTRTESQIAFPFICKCGYCDGKEIK